MLSFVRAPEKTTRDVCSLGRSPGFQTVTLVASNDSTGVPCFAALCTACAARAVKLVCLISIEASTSGGMCCRNGGADSA